MNTVQNYESDTETTQDVMMETAKTPSVEDIREHIRGRPTCWKPTTATA